GGTAAAARSWGRPARGCGARRVVITACFAGRARSPISTARTKWPAFTSPRRCPTARSSTRYAARREPEAGLQPPQCHFFDQVAFDLFQDEVGALASR